MYESVKWLVSLIIQNTVRYSMIVLFVSSVYSHYYGWWAYINYYNDEFYSQWNHQLFFSVSVIQTNDSYTSHRFFPFHPQITELISTGFVIHLANSNNPLKSRKVFCIVGISILHITASGFDQFVSHVFMGEGYPHQVSSEFLVIICIPNYSGFPRYSATNIINLKLLQIVRDVGLMVADVLHFILPLLVLRSEDCITKRPFYADQTIRREIIAMLCIVFVLFVFCWFL